MAREPIDFKGLGDHAAEAAKKAQDKHDAEFAPGPDISWCLCVCGRFGQWGDGDARYCKDHVPPQIQFAAQFFAETME